jgi:hypothetical protein
MLEGDSRIRKISMRSRRQESKIGLILSKLRGRERMRKEYQDSNRKKLKEEKLMLRRSSCRYREGYKRLIELTNNFTITKTW